MDRAPTCFSSESDFCSDCGSVLPPPGLHDTVTCLSCGHRTQVTEFLGKYIQRSVVFNKLDTIALSNESDETGALKGPQIDRRCSRCGCEKMVYYTRQMRSADEGQTVFYTCVQCRSPVLLTHRKFLEMPTQPAIGCYGKPLRPVIGNDLAFPAYIAGAVGTWAVIKVDWQFPGERRFMRQ